MILYGVRWPISRPQSHPGADSFFTALAGLVLEWLDHELPLCLPNTKDPLVRAVMEQTNANLATANAADICRTVGVSERSLRRAFPAATGMTWRQYLLESRILRAMALLSEPGLDAFWTSPAPWDSRGARSPVPSCGTRGRRPRPTVVA